ncbi:DUF3795 domain-containing protein [Chloroflexota bacterium]
MDKEMIAMCGAYCGYCEYKEKFNCNGCQLQKGELFHGTCNVATCCVEKGLLHCGLCSDLPCQALQEAFDQPEHGDNGERLANLKAWAQGSEDIIKLGSFKTKR